MSVWTCIGHQKSGLSLCNNFSVTCLIVTSSINHNASLGLPLLSSRNHSIWVRIVFLQDFIWYGSAHLALPWWQAGSHWDHQGIELTVLLGQLQGRELLVLFENFLELSEANLAVLSDVVYTDHLCYLLERNVRSTKSFESIDKVLFADKVRIIDIESLEEAMKHFFRKCFLQIECDSQELSVVDLLIAYVVDFSNYLVDCRVFNAYVNFFHGLG